MDMLLVSAALSIPIALNVWATRLVLRDPLITKHQRQSQLTLIWLLPLVGALLVLAVHRKEENPSRTHRSEPDPGDDYALSGRSVKGVTQALDGD